MPTMLYRRGATPNPEAWNEKLETCIVDEGDLEAVMSDGWYRHPGDIPAEDAPADPAAPAALSILDAGAGKIIAAIPELTADELQAILDGERVNKNRRVVIAALEKALQPPA